VVIENALGASGNDGLDQAAILVPSSRSDVTA